MDDKLKLKTNYENNLLEGKINFMEYVKQGKIKEWVEKYMPFIDDYSKESICKCYTQMYNNNDER